MARERPNGGERSEPAGGDAAERVRIAAESAAEQAEQRSMDEILALEEDLERAKDEAAEALNLIESRLAAAERRAREVEERAGDATLATEPGETDGALKAELEHTRAELARATTEAAEAERRVRDEVAEQVEIQTENLRRELETLRAEVDQRVREAADAAREEAEAAGEAEAEKRAAEATAEAHLELEERALQSATETRKQVEDRIRAEIEETKRVEIERLRGEAEERTRVEVEATRRAAQERFKAEIRLREQELESEREDKARIIVESDARLDEIEQRALAAAQRVPAAEAELAQEAEREVVADKATFAELAEEAERIGPERPDSEPAGEDLEPPGWVLDEAPVPAASETGEWDVDASVPEADSEPPASPGEGSPAGTYSLSTIEFVQLRGLGMSMTQAKRVLRYRDERGGFRSVDELDRVPGFPKPFLTEVKQHLVL